MASNKFPSLQELDDERQLNVDKQKPLLTTQSSFMSIAGDPVSASLPVDDVYPVPRANSSRCHIYSLDHYNSLYRKSIDHPDAFWTEIARNTLKWIEPFRTGMRGSLKEGDIRWFEHGKLNVCENCVDRWAEIEPDRVALIWEGDEPDQQLKITYKTLQQQVSKVANMLRALRCRKYDTVTIYMSMIPELVYTVLACARIGVIHSVVFAGYSSASVRERIRDCRSRVVITCDRGFRGGKEVLLKKTMDEALEGIPEVHTCIVFRHPHKPLEDVPMTRLRDVDGSQISAGLGPFFPLGPLDPKNFFFFF
eukprot:Filipodium_phascolosomae@DN3602_c0_g1_i1.p1